MYIRVNQRVFDWFVRKALIVLFFYCVAPWRFASHYEYLNREQMQAALAEEVTNNISLQLLPPCDYSEIIANNAYYFTRHAREQIRAADEMAIMYGGEYYPDECRARFSTAIIVPYRQREEQLHAFLIYMHNFLRQQYIHYRIFLVEQYDQKPFNRAKLFNIGSVIAAQHGFPCLILHDVDLLPLNLGQLYACTQQPRHLCSALDSFRFNLPYRGLFGGVVAIRTHQFRTINGMSNMYEGWGAEDDDLYQRLHMRGLDICRFAPHYSEYVMLQHKPETPSSNRLALLRTSSKRIETDGLNSLVYTEKERRMHSLFTHILVET